MTRCRLCGQREVDEVINFGKHPITKYLLDKSNQKFDTYPIVLSFCQQCSFLQLQDCIPSEILYGQQVNLSSWKNQPHIPQILDIIANLSGITHHSKILEIGCNDGSFLRELQRMGYKNLTGIDPGTPDSDSGIQYHRKFFANSMSEIDREYDLVILRHILEHIEKLADFGDCFRVISKEGTYFLIEVPDFDWFLKLSDYSGVWEEHVNYFTEYTIKRFLKRFGIEVLRTTKFNYSGQSLFAVCIFTGEQKFDTSQYPNYQIKGYRNNWPQYKKRLRSTLEDCKKDICVYGAGCRSTSLINYTGISDLISFVVDDQIEKQGKFLPGSKLPIKKPGYLYNSKTCLLAVNAENEEKVLNNHSHFVGEFHSILPLSRRVLSI